MSDFIDLGKKPKQETAIPCSDSSKDIYYPGFSISNKNLPIVGEEVGKTIIAQVKLKVTSISKNTTREKSSSSIYFDVLGINFPSKQVRG
jgi:hypothetical protein